MERVVKIHIKKLSEGVYLATSSEIQGLVAQGRTIVETLEIARDVAEKLLAAEVHFESPARNMVKERSFDYPLIVAT